MKNLIARPSVEEALSIFGLPDDTKVYHCRQGALPTISGNKPVVIRHSLLSIDSVEKTFIFRVLIKTNLGFREHNPNGPATIICGSKLTSFGYKKLGEFHRSFLPAKITFNNKGLIVEEVYIVSGKWHNRVGPAYRYTNWNGAWENFYYINDKKITPEEFYKMYDKLNKQ